MNAEDGIPGPPGDAAGTVTRTGATAGQAARRLRGDGWSVATLHGVATKTAFLDGVGRALGFPGYYGHNLDALWDCLAEVTSPTALVLEGWQDLAVGAPDAWADALSVLRERTAEGAPFCVVLVDPPGPA